ncbi:hypothetical protein EVAR_95522_1 [Eumeta japonica]|uniref:Uncharacterized protein n=1 Tax=Eumeta variegata TaxID=151549 RepID=A0A4C1UJK4_EUMVA|nr:hypothetical protein EVAR_95522_1 [Eumeta japonica]
MEWGEGHRNSHSPDETRGSGYYFTSVSFESAPTWLQLDRGGGVAVTVRCHTLKEYRYEIAASSVVFFPVSVSTGGPFPSIRYLIPSRMADKALILRVIMGNGTLWVVNFIVHSLEGRPCQTDYPVGGRALCMRFRATRPHTKMLVSDPINKSIAKPTKEVNGVLITPVDTIKYLEDSNGTTTPVMFESHVGQTSRQLERSGILALESELVLAGHQVSVQASQHSSLEQLSHV